VIEWSPDAEGYEVTGPLTVKDLLDIITQLPFETQVTFDDGDGWWRNVALVGVPRRDDRNLPEHAWVTLTFMRGEPFDARQT
jgi:hypothetical protein